MSRPRTRTDDEILRSARAVLLRQGPGAPLSSLARGAGLTAPALLARFRSREALVRQALAVPPVAPALAPLLVEPDRARLRGQLEAILAALVAWHREAVPRLVVLRGVQPLEDIGVPSPAPDEAPRLHPTLAIWLARAQAVGGVVVGDAQALASIVLSTIAGREASRLLQGDRDPASDRAWSAALVRLLLGPGPEAQGVKTRL